MQKLKIAFMATVMTLATLLGAFMPQVAKADQSQQWPVELLVSSAQARFEAQATGFDATTNKYKYKFSWLMPANRTYSFLIDGKPYMPKVTANGSAETPYWFSPDITYTISIYPYANGRGAIVGQGSFKAPSVTPPKPALTLEEEYLLFWNTVTAAPELPRRTMKSPSDVLAITELLNSNNDLSGYAGLKPYLSAESVALFDKLPLFVESWDNEEENSTFESIKPNRIKIYKGGQYASLRLKSKNLDSNATETVTFVFIKENGIWKIDFIQMMKIIFDELDES